jgi:hypothetical protein
VARRATQAALAIAIAAALGSNTVVSLPSFAVYEPDDPTIYLSDQLVGYDVAQAPYIASKVCLPDLSVKSLDTIFDTEPGGIIGADYPHTLALPDGKVLWTFQDARIRLRDGGARYVHNIGMIQIGYCFHILVGGSSSAPKAWLFTNHTAPEHRWFWPLGAEMGSDGQVYIFAAEMLERGEHYLERAESAGVFVARFNPANWNIDWYGRPSNQSSDHYGWSIESDDNFTYMFAYCNRQFGYDAYAGVFAHDRSCSDRVTVGRVPKGQLFDAQHYWNGSGWDPDPIHAVSVIGRRGGLANPAQFVKKNNRWMAITKVDDWWGDEILVESAIHPGGPFTEVARIEAREKCADCNSYFSSWIEGQNDNSPDAPMIGSLSHNRWDGEPSSVYRPTFFVVEPPPDQPAAAMRCALGQCE